MAAADLALGTMRVRQSTLSSLCAFLVKRGHLDTNPVARLARPPHRREAPRQVPGSAIMDALVRVAQQRRRPRDLAIFLILRYSGMRRESVATLRVRNLDRRWGLRNVPVKGGKTRDIPLPTAVMQHLDRYVELLSMITNGFLQEDKLFLTVGIGCTGGRHRSVAMAEALSERLRTRDVRTLVVHRDLGRE